MCANSQFPCIGQVWLSDIGIVAMAGLLTAWAMNFGVWHMLALYMGPLAVTNCWLVMYTWLQHTDVSHCLNIVYEMSAQLINFTFAQILLPCFHTQKGTCEKLRDVRSEEVVKCPSVILEAEIKPPSLFLRVEGYH